MTVWTRRDLHNREVRPGEWQALGDDGEVFDFLLAGTRCWLVFRDGDASPIVRGPSLESAEDALVAWCIDHRRGAT